MNGEVDPYALPPRGGPGVTYPEPEYPARIVSRDWVSGSAEMNEEKDDVQ